MNPHVRSLPPDLEAEVVERLRAWDADGSSRRLWDADASLWTGRDESKWLGWLRIAGDALADPAPRERIAREAAGEGFTHAVVLGMGGSSLCPHVLGATFGPIPGHPALLVLDSTDPGRIAEIEARLAPARTLFIVSSKSGTTLEPSLLRDYFLDRARKRLGEGAGGRFVAITDPGSALEGQAQETIPIGGAGLIVVYDHEHAEAVEGAVQRAIKRVVGEATDSHVKAVKAALADASAKMSAGGT